MSKIRNIGPVSAEWLRIIGIESKEELAARGAVEAYRAIRLHGFKASLNLLYALEAAIQGKDWRELSVQTKAKLRSQTKLSGES